MSSLAETIKALREGEDDGSSLPTAEDVRNEKRRRGLLRYVQDSIPDYKAGWVHEEICEELENFLRECREGKSPRLMLFLPPRAGKSEIASRRFPAWALGHYPDLEFIISSYSADLSTSFSDQTKQLCESDYHRLVFKGFEMGETQKKNEWFTKQGGFYKATGVDGSISGRGADVFVIDDPVKNWQEAYSETNREKTWMWYGAVAYTRLSPGAGILLIMTRWHEDDLAGRILKSETAEQWKLISYPAIATKDEAQRKRGEALHPERYDISRLKDIESTVGPRIWASLYQQTPRVEGGHHIQRDWFNIIAKADVPKEKIQWRRFWDLAIKAKQSSDYTASIRAGMTSNGNLYLMSGLRFKKEWPGTKKIIIQLGRIEKIPIGIETVSAFEIALQEIKPLLKGIVPVRGYQVTTDKLTRALPWIDLAECGKVFLVDGPWIEDFLEECERFDPIKNAYHDDQIDAVSGAYAMVRKASHRPRIL